MISKKSVRVLISRIIPISNWTGFVKAGIGAGTIVLRGNSYATSALPIPVYNLEVCDTIAGHTCTFDQILTDSGNLVVQQEPIQLNGTSTIVLYHMEDRYFSVKSRAYMTVIRWNAFQC